MSIQFRLTNRREPLLSLIVISPDSYATVQRTVRALKQQTIRDRLELVFVSPDASTFRPPPARLFHTNNATIRATLMAASAPRRAVSPVVMARRAPARPSVQTSSSTGRRGS